ncbi:MAG TPA: nitrate/sulfonate/bicarbonate ABC transporter ATP-binding protein [Stellaceae bacterium]|nr:nitrate/sulfonate/bicarbonate ABC transporter ATP-binding protein [Stellaceae bacterium]
MADQPLLNAKDVSKTYRTGDTAGRLVLDHVDFALKEGEIAAILGKSGCGKSTFLRILAGLTLPTGGGVTYRGMPVIGPAQGVAMVFQTFALFPWLTVFGNVELGLEAQGVDREERRKRALAAIDLIGLDGYESAYPKELSGGMRQRVGFARALVVNPDVLLLDEPFSALDVLTAETLRGDLSELWSAKRVPTKGIVFVSHNIDEAVEMSDRVIVFDSDPGRIKAEIQVPLPRPRDPGSPAFRQIVDEAYIQITTHPSRQAGKAGGTAAPQIGIAYRLPPASIQQLMALLDSLSSEPYNGRADLPKLAESEHLSSDELFPLIETLQVLGFAQVGGGDIEATAPGRAIAEADILKRKQIFGEHLMRNVPLVAHIRRVLDERPGHSAPSARFLSELEDHLSEEDAQEVFDTVINWARYAELFAYDYDRAVLSLENP